MIDHESDSDSNVEIPDAVSLLAEDFLSMHREGRSPDINDFCLRHPEFEERIRDLFPMLLMVEQCGVAANIEAAQTKNTIPGQSLPERIGDFKIVREIGRGGMGIVYEAEQQSLGRRVALKVLPTSATLSPSTIERFRRESRAAARLHHSNIVPVFGVGEDEGLHYYVMQYIPGVGLDQVLLQLAQTKQSHWMPETEKHPIYKVRKDSSHEQVAAVAAVSSSSGGRSSNSEDRIYWHRVALIGMQLANALHFAHTQGVLHRDIKPANILLDSSGMVWLTDFGLAQATDDTNLTRSGDIVGTLRYLAPERLKGECSQQSDVYGLGITLYELLTFVPAFPETDRVTLIRQVVQQEPKRLRAINPNIPRDLETIVLKAIDKEASRRYESAEELAEDLSRFLSDRPIRARRVVLVEQAWRWCRRNPTVSALGSTVGLLLLGLLIAWGMFSWVQSDRDRARSAERLANEARKTANREEAIAHARSHLAQAIGYRYSTDPGHKTKGLREIELAIGFDPPEEIKFELRNQAIAALAQTDIKFGQNWKIRSDSLAIAFDQQLKHVARLSSSGSISIRRLTDDEEIGHIVPETKGIQVLDFSKEGNFLLTANSLNGGTIEVWSVESSKKVIGPLVGCWTYDFDAQEKTIAVGMTDSHVHFYSLSTGAETHKLAMRSLPIAISYSPDSRKLAVVLRGDPKRLYVFDIESERAAVMLELEGSIRFCSWHPDGNRIALSCALPDNLEIWDVPSRTKLASMVGHSQEVSPSAFSQSGSFVTSGSWDGTLRIWDSDTGNNVAVFSSFGYTHGGHDSVVALRPNEGRMAAVEIDHPIGFQRLTNGNASKISRYTCGDISDDGRLLVAGTYNGLEIWDLVEHRKLDSIASSKTSSLIVDWLDRKLITVGESVGMQSWPIEGNEFSWRVGRPTVADNGSMKGINSSVTLDGACLAIIDGRIARVLSSDGQLIREIEVPSGHADVRLSPDGKMLATFGWFSSTTCIWNVDTGQLMKQFEGLYTTQNFSPDSKQLITGSWTDYTFRNLHDWEVVRRIERRDCSYSGDVAYSPNGDFVAMELTWGVLHLLRTDSFETVALLDSPKRNRPSRFKFAGKGNCLVAFHHLSGEIHIWKIDELRQRLASMHLDWENAETNKQPMPASDRKVSTSPVRIEFDLPATKPIDPKERSRKLIEVAERQLANSPDSLASINRLAWELVNCPEDMRQPLRAIALMETAHRTQTLDADGRNTLAVAYFRGGRFSDAVPLLRDNLEEQKDDMLSFDLYFLAMCYWQLDERDRAKETLEWADRMRGLKPPLDADSIIDLEWIRIEAHELIVG